MKMNNYILPISYEDVSYAHIYEDSSIDDIILGTKNMKKKQRNKYQHDYTYLTTITVLTKYQSCEYS